MMHMTFYWGKKVTLLIDSWSTDSWTGYLLTLMACLVLSVFHQYLENRRVRLSLIFSAPPNPPVEQIHIPLLQRNLSGVNDKLGVKAAKATMFGLNSAIAYLLMLAVMSFNGGVFLAIVLGLAIGYYFFRSGDEEVSVVVENGCACA